jgi:hypothetical protein
VESGAGEATAAADVKAAGAKLDDIGAETECIDDTDATAGGGMALALEAAGFLRVR